MRARRRPSLAELRRDYDAVFLGVGLGPTPSLGIPGEEHVVDGLEYIERSKIGTTELQIGKQLPSLERGTPPSIAQPLRGA